MRAFLIAATGANREKIEELLDSSEIGVVGWANDLKEIDEEIAAEAELVLVDSSGTALEEILDTLLESRVMRETEIVLLIDEAAPVLVNRALRAGVRGILPTEVGGEQLAAALEAVGRGLTTVHPDFLRVERSGRNTLEDTLEDVEPLTAREREVLQMLSEGMGNKEIAGRLKISEHTAKFHVASILGKLGASSRTEAVSVALRRGLVLL